MKHINIFVIFSISIFALIAVSLTSSMQPLPLMKPNPLTSPTPAPLTTHTPLPEGVVAVTKGEFTPLPNTSLTLLLTRASIPSDKCRDCITDIAIEVNNGTEKQTIAFKSGGIMGSLPTNQIAFGYVFDLYQVNQGDVLIQYKKQ